MATATATKCWADMEDEMEEVAMMPSLVKNEVKKGFASYAAAVTCKLLTDANLVSCPTTAVSCPTACSTAVKDDDNDGFMIVKKKEKEMKKKCETAVFEWAMNKGKVPSSTDTSNDIICCRCALPFVFNENMKMRYVQKGWKVPKICKICSQARFEEQQRA